MLTDPILLNKSHNLNLMLSIPKLDSDQIELINFGSLKDIKLIENSNTETENKENLNPEMNKVNK